MPVQATGGAGAGVVVGAESYGRDVAIEWFRGEFAAANAIIDALCAHLRQLAPTGEYEAAFAAIHRRRMNWIPVIQFQKFFSISEIASELRRVAADVKETRREPETEVDLGLSTAGREPKLAGTAESLNSGGSGSGSGSGSSQEDHSSVENVLICSDHEECGNRREKIKISKGFVVKEQMKGHMVNVVKGLKVFDEVFTDTELSKLGEFIGELRTAGRNGELSGETFIFFNKELKGNKREIIQLGVPIFQHATDEEAGYIEPIPSILQDVIDHLVQWHLISPSKKPNSCLINFFDEGEHSHPYFKPPHLDHPISTLVLSETTMAFGRSLTSDNQGNYKGSLTLDLKKGSFVVMRGHSADVARHVVCPSETSRVTITFAKVRPCSSNQSSNLSPKNSASFVPQALVPAWGMAIQAPIIMLPSPQSPPVENPEGKKGVHGGNGTGVFLPWTMGSKKYIKQLPPRIQKRRLPMLPPLLRMQVDKAASSVSFVCS